jgi:hypothetical protein
MDTMNAHEFFALDTVDGRENAASWLQHGLKCTSGCTEMIEAALGLNYAEDFKNNRLSYYFQWMRNLIDPDSIGNFAIFAELLICKLKEMDQFCTKQKERAQTAENLVEAVQKNNRALFRQVRKLEKEVLALTPKRPRRLKKK